MTSNIEQPSIIERAAHAGNKGYLKWRVWSIFEQF